MPNDFVGVYEMMKCCFYFLCVPLRTLRLKISLLPIRGINIYSIIINSILFIAKTICSVVINHAHRLHIGITDGTADKFKSALF